MRLACILIVLAAFPSPAGAQSIRVARAELREERASVGTLAGAPVEIVRWESARRARIRFEDRAIALEASIDLRSDGTRAQVGVGDDVAVAGGPWSITMLAGTWAPLVGRGEGERPRVLLPRGLPMRRGTIGRAVAPAVDPPRSAFHHLPIDWQRWSPSCQGITMRAAPGSGPRWRLPPGSLVRVGGTRAPYAIQAWVDGFVLHGHTDRRPSSCGGGISADLGFGRGCMGAPIGELRVVPAGTAIHAGAVTVATLRTDLVGRIAGDGIQVMHTEPSGASWSIAGTIDTPLESLAPVAEPPEDMRLCTDAIAWPEE